MAYADRAAIVYMAVNRGNGKRYVGVTSKRLAIRVRQHHARALTGDKRGRLPAAIRKYGCQAFEWLILAKFASEEAAYEAEKFFIGLLGPEYNVSTGGSVGVIGSTRPPITEDQRASLRARGLANRDNFRKYAHLGPKASARQIICLNTMQRYLSAAAAGRAHNVPSHMVIEVSRRKRSSIGGFVFRYADDDFALKEDAAAIIEAARNRQRRATLKLRKTVFTSDGLVFPSAVEASRHYGLHRSSISELCRGVKSSRTGVVFSYEAIA